MPDITSATIDVFVNDGLGTFPSPVRYPAGLGGGKISSADFDGNGSEDLAAPNQNGQNELLVAHFYEGSVGVMFNAGGSLQPPIEYAVGAGPATVR